MRRRHWARSDQWPSQRRHQGLRFEALRSLALPLLFPSPPTLSPVRSPQDVELRSASALIVSASLVTAGWISRRGVCGKLRHKPRHT